MPTLTFQGATYQSLENESILDCLIRHNLKVPHGCKSGACQSCMMHAAEGTPTPASQAGLKDAVKADGYFLSCSCIPTQDMQIALEQFNPKIPTSVVAVEKLNSSVLRLRLSKTIDYSPGQYLNIWKDEQTIRSYSIASHPKLDNFIELHIKLLPNGRFSTWAWEHLQPGAKLDIQGPIGTCFYTNGHPQNPMLLVGIGTGLAPLLGIVKDALYQKHTGEIELIWGAKTPSGFYGHDTLKALQRDHSNLSITYLSQCDQDIYDYVKTQFPSTKGHKVFLCGAASFVRKMKKQCFLAGANMKDISADAFLPCA